MVWFPLAILFSLFSTQGNGKYVFLVNIIREKTHKKSTVMLGKVEKRNPFKSSNMIAKLL